MLESEGVAVGAVLASHPNAVTGRLMDPSDATAIMRWCTARGAHFIATMLAKSKVPRTRTMGGTWRDQEALA